MRKIGPISIKMDKERKDIPLWTWYNGQFLFQFDEQLRNNPDKTISTFFNDFLICQGINNFNFFQTKNQGVIILLMYGLLVIPREIWEKDTTNFSFKTRQKFIFNPPTDSCIATLDFLRLLRNAIAHANFSLDTSTGKFTFWNNRGNGEKNFEVKIGYADLGVFVEEIGTYYINEVRNITP